VGSALKAQAAPEQKHERRRHYSKINPAALQNKIHDCEEEKREKDYPLHDRISVHNIRCATARSRDRFPVNIGKTL
jgi:hypothetical protein